MRTGVAAESLLACFPQNFIPFPFKSSNLPSRSSKRFYTTASMNGMNGINGHAATPPLWSEAKNADGRIYYYNTVTKATQWTKPEELMTPAEVTPPSSWTAKYLLIS